jgi:hypothetical protein
MAKKRIALAGLLAAIAVGATSTAAESGTQKRSTSTCPDGRLCVWEKPDYRGQKVVIRKRALTNKLHDEMNDQASSLKLRKSGVAVLYADVEGEGLAICAFGPRDNIPDLSDYQGFDFDNEASSSEINKEKVTC